VIGSLDRAASSISCVGERAAGRQNFHSSDRLYLVVAVVVLVSFLVSVWCLQKPQNRVHSGEKVESSENSDFCETPDSM
jgi:hypothetical protein